MGSRTEQTFFQRGHADDQQAHEMMFNIANQQRDANQNDGQLSPHTCHNEYNQKTNAGKRLEKRESLVKVVFTVRMKIGQTNDRLVNKTRVLQQK